MAVSPSCGPSCLRRLTTKFTSFQGLFERPRTAGSRSRKIIFAVVTCGQGRSFANFGTSRAVAPASTTPQIKPAMPDFQNQASVSNQGKSRRLERTGFKPSPKLQLNYVQYLGGRVLDANPGPWIQEPALLHLHVISVSHICVAYL